MSYDENDAARDEFYEQLSRELYNDHKQQAIAEFSADRLKSFYIQHPNVMRPAVDALQEGKWLQGKDRFSAALVFYVSAIELLLKATLLRPVVYGLVHHDGLAEIVVKHTLGQTGFDRYERLLAELFSNLAKINIKEIRRDGSTVKLLEECHALQRKRNNVIHQGARYPASDAEDARVVAVAVYDKIVTPMLFSIGLTVIEKGAIVPV
jgi:hypothetical protein